MTTTYYKNYRELVKDATDDMLKQCKKYWTKVFQESEGKNEDFFDLACSLLAVIAIEEQRRA